MPRRDPPGTPKTVMPTPDLAVAFKTSSFVNKYQMLYLGLLRQHMCPEAFKIDKEDRAFHFFSIEAKDAKAVSAENNAANQNLNTASQALYNIYLFMQKAEDLDSFYEDVRFFSVVATSSCLNLRVHRSIQLPEGEDEGRLFPDYPLAFEFEEIFSREGHYAKKEAVWMVENILIEYGVKVLKPILQRVVKTVLRKLKDEPRPVQSLLPKKRRRTAGSIISVDSGQSEHRRKTASLGINGRVGSPLDQTVPVQ